MERLIELGETVKDTALCGLGQTAPNPVLSTIRYFREEYDEHIRKKYVARACVGPVFCLPVIMRARRGECTGLSGVNRRRAACGRLSADPAGESLPGDLRTRVYPSLRVPMPSCTTG